MYEIYEKLTQIATNSSILIVDDNDEILEEMMNLLKLFFKKVDKAENGQIGLSKAKKFNYDVILTDLDMPILNGIEMIREIKILNPNQQFITLSGYIDAHKKELSELKIEFILEKPYFVDILFETIIKTIKTNNNRF